MVFRNSLLIQICTSNSCFSYHCKKGLFFKIIYYCYRKKIIIYIIRFLLLWKDTFSRNHVLAFTYSLLWFVHTLFFNGFPLKFQMILSLSGYDDKECHLYISSIFGIYSKPFSTVMLVMVILHPGPLSSRRFKLPYTYNGKALAGGWACWVSLGYPALPSSFSCLWVCLLPQSHRKVLFR